MWEKKGIIKTLNLLFLMDASIYDTPVNETCNDFVSVEMVFQKSMTEQDTTKKLMFALLILESLLILAILFFSIK